MDEEKLLSKKEILKSIEENLISSDDIEEDDSADDYGEVKEKRLITDKQDPTVASLYLKYINNKLNLQPKYQRKYVMKATVASRLIESMLLGIPIPVVYFAEEEDGSFSVIDGQQRLTAIISFIQGKFLHNNKIFKLTGLNVLKDLEGKTWKDLTDSQIEKINDTSIRSIIILKESSDDIKFEIFERLNTGSTPLNEDEIRNTIYRGTYMDLLTELEDDDKFNKIVDKPNLKNRMIYRGMILRFFAFKENTYLNYKPSMKTFCNKHIKQNRNMSIEKVEEYKKLFKDTIDKVYTIFGKNAFRRMTKIDGKNDYEWSKTRINLALYDIQMFGFTRYSKEALIRHRDEISDRMFGLMVDEDFISSIEKETSNTTTVNYRFKKWLEVLDDIMKQEINIKNPRCFPDSIKREMFDEDPTCKLCGQLILNYDDAHVDHIKPYSKGGLTVKENGQLTHRFCNQHKSNH